MRFISIIGLITLSLFLHNEDMLKVCFYWVLILLLEGNIKRLPPINIIPYFIRMTMYFVIYGIPSFVEYIVGDKVIRKPNNSLVIIGCIVALFAFGAWLFLNRKILKVYFSKESIANTVYFEKHVLVLHIYNNIGAAFFEELFFRKYLLSVNISILIMLPISIILFFLSHWCLPWGASFTKRDTANQLFLAIVNGVLFLLTQSIIPCILLHLSLNMIQVVRLFLQLDRWHIRKSEYDKHLEDTVYDELTLQ